MKPTLRIGLSAALLAAAALVSGCGQKPLEGPVLTLAAAETMSHQIGRYVDIDKSLVASPGDKGYLHFGPYAELPIGSYRAVFEVSVEGANGKVGRVDVNAFKAGQPESIQGSMDLAANGNSQTFPIDFETVAGMKYEFRVLSEGLATIKLRSIVVRKR